MYALSSHTYRELGLQQPDTRCIADQARRPTYPSETSACSILERLHRVERRGLGPDAFLRRLEDCSGEATRSLII